MALRLFRYAKVELIWRLWLYVGANKYICSEIFCA